MYHRVMSYIQHLDQRPLREIVVHDGDAHAQAHAQVRAQRHVQVTPKSTSKPTSTSTPKSTSKSTFLSRTQLKLSACLL